MIVTVEHNTRKASGSDILINGKVVGQLPPNAAELIVTEITTLRAALRPFAEFWTSGEGYHPFDTDYREAARVLENSE